MLSFGASVVYDTDVALVHTRGAWLNDAIITLWFELLTARAGRNDVLLLHPATAFVAAYEEDVADRFAALSSLRLHERRRVLVPVCDASPSTTPCNGSHWTLLVLEREKEDCSDITAVHFDSMTRRGDLCANDGAASRIAEHLIPLMVAPTTSTGYAACDSRSTMDVHDRVTLVPGKGGYQSDGFSCGVFMLLTAHLLLLTSEGATGDYSGNVTQSAVNMYRDTIRDDIDALISAYRPRDSVLIK